MDQDKKPLFTLTISEFIELTRSFVAEEVERVSREHQEETNKTNQETTICEIDQVVKITRLARATLYSKVSKKHIPCLSRGKPLLFSRDHIEMWLKAGRPPTDSINAIEEILKNKQHEG